MKNLVQIIKNNPGCVAQIDNDSWRLLKTLDYPEGFDDWDDDRRDEWEENNILADAEDQFDSSKGFEPLKGSSCTSNNCYGTGILLALAEIVGIEITSV